MFTPQEHNASELKQTIEKKLNQYARDTESHMKIQVSFDHWMYHEPGPSWVQTLRNIYSQVTGQAGKSVEAADPKVARKIPNAINLRTSTPDHQATGHTPNEFKTTKDMQMHMRMFTEIMLRISNLPHMQ